MKHLICGTRGCRKRARFFGAFAGGLCLDHALRMALEFGLDGFHPEHRDTLRVAMPKRRVADIKTSVNQ